MVVEGFCGGVNLGEERESELLRKLGREGCESKRGVYLWN